MLSYYNFQELFESRDAPARCGISLPLVTSLTPTFAASTQSGIQLDSEYRIREYPAISDRG
jgi:hypothetical protein